MGLTCVVCLRIPLPLTFYDCHWNVQIGAALEDERYPNLGSDVTIDHQGRGAHIRGGMWGISVVHQEDEQF